MESESRLVVVRGWGGEVGSDCSWRQVFLWRMTEMFWNQKWWLHSMVNILNATELYILND